MALLGRGFRNRRDYEKALEQLHNATDDQQRASEAVAALLVVQGRPLQKACAKGRRGAPCRARLSDHFLAGLSRVMASASV